jgi:hypothetical protein
MAFASGLTTEIGVIGSGEIVGNVGVITSYTLFEEELQSGLFCKYNADDVKIEKIDGEADPVIAGVVKREVTSALENNGLYKKAETLQVDVIESGLISVEVVGGLDIKKFDKVYVYNNTNKNTNDWGKATNHPTDKDNDDNDVDNAIVDGYFYKQISDTVWIIRLK